MKWNVQTIDWPNFRPVASRVIPLEQKFLQSAGECRSAFQ